MVRSTPVMTLRLPIAAALLIAMAAACDGCDTPNAPLPPLPRDLPDAAFASYPHDDAGLPILMASTFDGYGLELVYDQELDDPITRWGECLDRVASCLATNRGRLGSCVDRIEICDAGDSRGCCPRSCIDAYQRERTGKDEREAVLASFVAGRCIEGLEAQLSILDEPDVTP